MAINRAIASGTNLVPTEFNIKFTIDDSDVLMEKIRDLMHENNYDKRLLEFCSSLR